jgi:peptidoglycan/xylan/chitin deacetylase (PgdA/CDA1 family)
VGAHTVNHVDLGTITLDRARIEIVESGQELSAVLGTPISLFSFPFGSVRNIRQETADIVMHSNYEALFSAHGGFVGLSTGLSDIPRMGCSGDTRPLYLLLEIEGLAPNRLKSALTG